MPLLSRKLIPPSKADAVVLPATEGFGVGIVGFS